MAANSHSTDLEAEIGNLRSALETSGLELSAVKTQLANINRSQMKLENEKIALERSSAKKVDELKSQLEDANFELEDYRRNDGGGGRQELEKAKKAAKVEIEVLQQKADTWEVEAQASKKEMVSLKAKVARLDELEASLNEERKARLLAEQSATPSESPGEDIAVEKIRSLTEKVANLEADLASARSMPTSSSATITDKATRQLRRELDTALREKTYLEDQLKEQDDEILTLRGRIPIPDSPAQSPRTVPSIDAELLSSLETQVVALQTELEQRESAKTEEIHGLEVRLDEATKELEAAKADVFDVQASFDVYRGEMEVSRRFKAYGDAI